MSAKEEKRGKSVRINVLLCAVFLLVGCGLEIVLPAKNSSIKTFPVSAEVKFKSALCGPFRATLDGKDVTNLFPNLAPGINWTSARAVIVPISPGLHTLTATADMDLGFIFSDCKTDQDATNFTVGDPKDTPYMAQCRWKGVPIPPDWKPSGTTWQDLGIINESLFEFEPSAGEHIWVHTDPRIRGACAGLLTDAFLIICQSASTGYACFWETAIDFGSPDPRVVGAQISQLLDGSNLGYNCTLCHRGNNAFIIAPDASVFRDLIRGLKVVTWPGVGAGPIQTNFTTRVEASSDNQIVNLADGTSYSYPRYIPVPGQAGWVNPLPNPSVGCAGACHENQKFIDPNGFPNPVKIPIGMGPSGPNCSKDPLQPSAPRDPARCYD